MHYCIDILAIYRDYTSRVARARAAFNDTKKVLCGLQGIRYGLLYPTRLCIAYKDLDKEFVDPAKAMEFVNRHITQAAEERE